MALGLPAGCAADTLPKPVPVFKTVILILLDDAGFGGTATFGSGGAPRAGHVGQRRTALQPISRQLAVLAHACRAAFGPQRPRNRIRQNDRMAQARRLDCRNTEVERLSYGGIRQVAQYTSLWVKPSHP